MTGVIHRQPRSSVLWPLAAGAFHRLPRPVVELAASGSPPVVDSVRAWRSQRETRGRRSGNSVPCDHRGYLVPPAISDWKTQRTVCLEEVLPDRPNGGLGPVGHADLAQDVLNVLLDRLVADAQLLGDFFVGQPERHLA